MTTQTLHPSITFERVEAAARESMFGLGSTGFCRECGEEREGCEPDAQGYECEACGAHAVDSAEILCIEAT